MIPLLGVIQVAYAAPSITAVNVPTLTEGTEGSFRVSYTSSGTTTANWSFGNGDTATGQDVDYAYADNGTWTVRVTVTDSTGSTSTTRNVSVSNVAPTVTSLTGDSTGDEGETLSFACAATDPGDDTITYTWDFGDDESTTGASPSHVYVQNGTYTVTCTASDEDGGSDDSATTVVVANVAATLDLTGTTSGTEGDTFAFDAGTADPGSEDTHTYVWTWDDGETSTGTSQTAEHVYVQDGSYSVRLSVVDSDGGISTDSLAVTVDNGAPSDVVVAGDATGDEGDTLAFSCTGTDPGVEDLLTYTWDFGDGSTSTGDSVTHAFTQDGSYAVSCTLSDEAGASDTDTLAVVVANVAPTVDAVTGDTEPEEGATATFAASASDPGSDTLSYGWDFGDGSTATGSDATHAWADNGTYTVTLTVDDGDGGSDSEELSVSVTNVAPTVSGEPETVVTEGGVYSFEPGVLDPGADTFIWSGVIPADATLDAATGAIAWSPGWRDLGSHDFELTVEDDDGASASLAWAVGVSMSDADADGMSDLWEAEYGLDPSDPADAALDADGDGRTNADEFEAGTDPNVNDGPTAPVLSSPLDGAEVESDLPSLVFEPGTSPTGDVVTHRVEVYEDEDLSLYFTGTDGLADTGSAVSWAVDVPLAENTWYWWRAATDDTWSTGAWTDAAGFFVNTVNEAPGAPGVRAPLDGASVDTLAPTFEVDAPLDPDLDALSYVYTLSDESGGLVEEAESAEELWTIGGALEDGGTYCWTAYAVDEHGLAGEASEEACFVVDISNQAPTVATILAPEDELAVDTNTPDVVIWNGVDPEGRRTWQVIQLDTDATYQSDDFVEAWVESDESGTTTWTTTALREDTWYYLRVLTTDGAADGGWDEVHFRVDSENSAPEAPTLSLPIDGDIVGENVWLVVDDPSDPDGDALARLDFEVTDQAGTVVAGGSVEPDGSGSSSWETDVLAPGIYAWTARAVDERSAAGEWATPHRFEVDRAVGNDDDDLVVVGDTDGCGCGTTSGSPGMVGLLAVLLARRRRRR